MTRTGIATFLRGLGASFPIVLLCAVQAGAQLGPGGRSQTCVRLESQLTAIDRGAVDPARADQAKRYEDSAGKQQADLDRLESYGYETPGSSYMPWISGAQTAASGRVRGRA